MSPGSVKGFDEVAIRQVDSSSGPTKLCAFASSVFFDTSSTRNLPGTGVYDMAV